MPTDEGEIEDVRDTRIRQLQGALDSRIAIEQAKGVLAERFGLTMDDAFAVLRDAARSNGVKINQLAAEVAAAPRTPLAVTAALARAGYGPDEGFKRRAALAEQFVADLNDALADVHAKVTWTSFVCECSNPVCAEKIEVTSEIVESVHANPGQYVVKAGHEVPELEDTVAVVDGVLVVQKHLVA